MRKLSYVLRIGSTDKEWLMILTKMILKLMWRRLSLGADNYYGIGKPKQRHCCLPSSCVLFCTVFWIIHRKNSYCRVLLKFQLRIVCRFANLEELRKCCRRHGKRHLN
ncbi:uncharacterized protein LOC132063299 isoform X1 [Lycium ferocissimum]|uniref:uncharacterized protein LOC132063299 isoform X1 n=1 Tax=Lycium ferocissimum TaxID=112874 RepID=UPI0028155BC1|nr:uncharacterized protein LOC132063299 isoform X1 [Lycium ferocissimum]